MKAMGNLIYFASLPIQWILLFLGTVIYFILVILVGSHYMGISLYLHFLAPVVFLLAAVSVSAIGALIGTAARTPEESGSLITTLTFLLMGIGPVFIQPEKLHPILLILGKFSPATFAASAVRQVLIGPVTPQIWADLGILLAFSLASLWIVSRKMEWRQ
jgi:ABC-2 type transport system permease protein